MEGFSTFVSVALASLFLLMLLMFFFLQKTTSKLDKSIGKEYAYRDESFMQMSNVLDSEMRKLEKLTERISFVSRDREAVLYSLIDSLRRGIPIVNINELKNISDNLDQFAKGIKDLSSFLSGVKELNTNLNEYNLRTEALVTIADFYKKQMTDIETRQDAIRSSVVKLDDQMQSALRLFEENSKKGLDQLQQTFLHQMDMMERTSHSSSFEGQLQNIDSALKAVALLQPLQDSISKLNDRLLSIKPENYSLSCNTFANNVKPYDLSREIREKERLSVIIKETDTKITTIKQQIDNNKKQYEELNIDLERVSSGVPGYNIIDDGNRVLIEDEMLRRQYSLDGWGHLRMSELEFLRDPILRNNLMIYFNIKKEKDSCQKQIKERTNELNNLTQKRTQLENKMTEISIIENTLDIIGRGSNVRHEVVDNSMAPTITKGDNVIVCSQKEGYYKNDIVYVRLLNCYRIRRIIRPLGRGEIEVRGDANEYPEYAVVADIIGKVIKIEKKAEEKRKSKK